MILTGIFVSQGTHLDKRLHFASHRYFLLTHAPCHLAGVTLNASNYGVGVGPILCAVILLPDNNDLFAGLTTLEYDRDLIQR